jgi:hypothetical protein
VVPPSPPSVSPLLPLTAISADTSLLEVRNQQQDVEIKRLTDEITSRDGMCDALKLQVAHLTVDIEKARLNTVERDDATVKLEYELSRSVDEQESFRLHFSREVADVNTKLQDAVVDKDAALRQVKLVRDEVKCQFS